MAKRKRDKPLAEFKAWMVRHPATGEVPHYLYATHNLAAGAAAWSAFVPIRVKVTVTELVT